MEQFWRRRIYFLLMSRKKEKEKDKNIWRRKNCCGMGGRTDMEGSKRGSHRPKMHVDPLLEHVHYVGIY